MDEHEIVENPKTAPTRFLDSTQHEEMRKPTPNHGTYMPPATRKTNCKELG